jgi:serine/threonine protein kinase
MDSNKLIANKYRIINKIGSGSFGFIFKGINVRTNEKVAIKIENVSDELKLLKHESNVYRILSNIVGVPKIKWYGKDELYYYMVIDLYGKSLQDLIDIKNKLSFKTTLQIGINILNILMKIHDVGFVHRDIKPENFLLTLDKPTKICLIDFGLSKLYVINNKHIDFKYKKKFLGTLNFASINSHNFCEQSRRDDLESLSYMLLYFYFGELEWINKETNIIENFEIENTNIKEQKETLIKRINNIPKVLLEFHENITKLTFEERPNYEMYIESFMDELNK